VALPLKEYVSAQVEVQASALAKGQVSLAYAPERLGAHSSGKQVRSGGVPHFGTFVVVAERYPLNPPQLPRAALLLVLEEESHRRYRSDWLARSLVGSWDTA